ncbi:hypothetical protein ACFQ7O_31385 [Streptomyces sp. NPDC056485]|uniref:hypothetical protein n=1 Tax=Streptomyces sp. NPDC056485 TaxID=3345834 RepID=UPI003695D9D5
MRTPRTAWWRRAAVALLCSAGLVLPLPPAAADTTATVATVATGHPGGTGHGTGTGLTPRALTFPVNETFDSATTIGTTIGGAASTGDGWMRLTSAATGQAGTWKTNDSFSSGLGIVAEFTYATYGGTAFEGKRGDGMSFYLTDGAAANGVGGTGGALGYACTMIAGTLCSAKSGVPGAYLGIGLDEFGNFSSNGVGNGGPGAAPNKIVLRGGGNGSTGYRFATSVDGPGSTVETGTRAKFRTVRVALLPSGTKMLLSVWSDSGPGTTLAKLMSDYDVTTIAGQPALPGTLKVGFAAGTGSATNIHEIGDLKINVPVDLTIGKSVNSASVPAGGGPVTYTVTVSNSSANDVAGAVVRDPVPGLTGVTWKCAAGTGGTCGQSSGSGAALDTTADLKRGGSVTYTLTGTAPAQPTTLLNTATVTAPADRTDTNPADNTATSSATTVTARADVAATKEALGTGPVFAGREFYYQITATNRGPSDTTAVDAVDVLPGPLAFVSSPADCTATGQIVTCPARATLAAGKDTAWTIRVRLDPAYRGDGTDLLNAATVRHAVTDPQPANNTSPGVGPPGGLAPPQADLVTVKTPSDTRPVAPGETYGYTVTVTNRGPSVAREVRLSDPLVPALAYVASADGCATTGTGTGRTVSCGPEAELAPGTSRTWRFTVRLDPAHTGDGSTVRNTATATAVTFDPDTRNNSGTAGVPGGTVRPAQADVELTKRATAG